MKTERLTGVLLAGHKGAAVEVAFDPAIRWSVPAVRLWPGRHGHRVQGRLNGIAFESAVVPRARGFFLLVSEELMQAAGLAVGDSVQVTLQLHTTEAGRRPGPPSPARSRRSPRRPPVTP
jgi:hypothetical protein